MQGAKFVSDKADTFFLLQDYDNFITGLSSLIMIIPEFGHIYDV